MSDQKIFSASEQTRASMRPPARGRVQMAVSGHSLATCAAMRILDKGGNAVDAGVAGAICLAVLQPDMVSFAGVAPLLIHHAPSGKTRAVTGLGCWPKAAGVDYFLEHHQGQLPPGILRSVVPGAPDAYIQALLEFGSLSFSEIVADALDLAQNGFPVHQFLRDRILEAEDSYRRWPENSAIFLPQGKIPAVGELFLQKDLAATFRAMAEAEAACRGDRAEGLKAARSVFYTGAVGRGITDFHAAHGGLISPADMENFACDIEDPLVFNFGEYSILTHGPWCQGPVLPMTLNILHGVDLAGMGHNSPHYVHTVAEAFKLAFADRERLFGDPRFTDVPLNGLLSPEYGTLRRARIGDAACKRMPPSDDPFAAEGRPAPESFNPLSDPEDAPASGHSLDTSHICVIDRQGSFFSATPSDMSFDTRIIPGTGLAVSSRGSQSWLIPGHPSSVEGGKRPRLTPTACLVLRRGRPWLILGTPGGDIQCQTNLQVLFNLILFGMDAQEAVEAPRFGVFCFPDSFYPHTYSKGILRLESRISADTAQALSALGHEVRLWPDWAWKAGGACLILREGESLSGGADPRRECCGMGW
ncbi:MAG: gamma-glutamyltransferase family protein [Desulfovibrio sp.]|jgi:gamma-glutamyltranspeptidase/glutathione hydrolase|nr:gamma-glutamyltransferase family protein [Desulfovibrio sp.]